MLASPYELPSREDNPFWPMPSTYGPRLPAERKGECCLRCEGAITGDRAFCDGCLADRKNNRLELMRGWYDPGKPNVLMRAPDLFLAALAFYVDFYVKAAACCQHQYPLPDCRHKILMQTMFTRPRSALVSPRSSGKTFAMVYELCQFIAVTRPNTGILLGSETKDLTKEKIKEIRRRTETNEKIAHDFGIVWSLERSTSRDWSNVCLDFLNGSQIKGSSIDQATRGRHPLVGLIDDPEGKRARNANWRKQFMNWLFQDYLNQFDDKGTHVMWIGTILDVDSCLYRAVHNDDPEKRFIAWERQILSMVHTDPQTGQRVSCWPEKLTVEEFERKIKGSDDEDGSITPIGLAGVMAEFQGTPVPRGDRMFLRDERRNGYVLYHDDDGKRRMYDPATGKSRDYDEFFEECFRYGAMDAANSLKKRADENFIVVGFYDADGVLWFMDAWAERCFFQKAVQEALRRSHQHRLGKFLFEEALLDDIAMREALHFRKERLENGFHVPLFQSMPTGGVSKPLRIERMQPLWDAGRIKLPLFREIDGYQPIDHPSREAMDKLIQQFDTQTIEEDANRRDDGCDAAEKIHRAAARRPPKLSRKTKGQAILESWEAKGIEVDPMMAPESNWTPRMRKKFQERLRPRETNQIIGACDGFC